MDSKSAGDANEALYPGRAPRAKHTASRELLIEEPLSEGVSFPRRFPKQHEKSILKNPCESNVVDRRENVNIYEENNRLIHYYLQSNSSLKLLKKKYALHEINRN